MEFRKDIAGLRAIAIILVLAYHYDISPFTGGFIGVDVFFVISGFLITLIMKTQLENNKFNILLFYLKRILRIFPAMLVMLITINIAGYLIFMPGDYILLSKNSVYSIIGIPNYFLLHNTGYFDQSSSLIPTLNL